MQGEIEEKGILHSQEILRLKKEIAERQEEKERIWEENEEKVILLNQ